MRGGNVRKIGCVIAAAAFSLSLSPGVNAQAGVDKNVPKLSASNSQQIARETEPYLQAFVDKQRRMPGQAKQVLVKVTPDPLAQVIWIDLDAGYVPKGMDEFGESFGELVREVQNEGYELLSGIVGFEYIRVRMGGKTLNEIFPPEHLKKKRDGMSGQVVAPLVAGLVVINPGHGKYLHHADNTWRYQRPVAYTGTTDVYEDIVTPGYASMLASVLTARSASTITNIQHTRDLGNTAIDPESGLAWAALGARYYMKRLYPALGATIWNKFPNGGSSGINLREYDEDIRSRPEYANYINAETMISLHTDAADSSARGATVITNIDNVDSVQLAKNVQCYLTEQITQLPEYADYVIRQGVKDGDNYGEVRVAAMPTVLVELGFHTNPEDAAALQDPIFRAAAAKGIEKGYRTFKAGETACKPLTITSAPPVTGKHNTKIPFTVQFSGTPLAAPMYLRSKVVTCPPDYTCSQTSEQYLFQESDLPDILSGTSTCSTYRPVPGGVILEVDRYLEDRDGVRSPKVRSTINCT